MDEFWREDKERLEKGVEGICKSDADLSTHKIFTIWSAITSLQDGLLIHMTSSHSTARPQLSLL